jgi:hypothetical protein
VVVLLFLTQQKGLVSRDAIVSSQYEAKVNKTAEKGRTKHHFFIVLDPSLKYS